ncbi:MAG: polyisoprenoid-binding protein [Proteobacteria bacterium]|jgi:polyisoprenoid-binding protein YceI|nr:polyisoprenoid-binding protein [Pseudomonadota bacterium]
MSTTTLRRIILFIASSCVASFAIAEPVTYEVEPTHTFPTFETDHWGGLSIWRGKINKTSGSIVFDREAQSGDIEVVMDMASIDFGYDPMNERAINDVLHVAEFPTATYTGTLADFADGNPTAVEGTLSMHGVTKALNLSIDRFKCQPHHRTKVEVCGADASATLNRADYGIDYDLANGFFPEVMLRITVEAHRQES